jgi:thiamine kinase-like enzyme
MEIERESGWNLHPIGGETGQAYMGVRDEEKIFLKKNSSPFLAALSLEGITPRLIWTKRTGNGDVLTAQEWCNGRTLNKKEMTSGKIANILVKVHRSDTLKRLLNRVGGEEISAVDLLADFEEGLTSDLENHSVLEKAYHYLLKELPLGYTKEDIRVCHGDISSENMLLSDDGELFIVDWDTAVLMDYLFDIGQLFARYIDINDWGKWIDANELHYTQNEKSRVKWYAMINLLLDIKYAHRKTRYNKMNELILKLNRWLEIGVFDQ